MADLEQRGELLIQDLWEKGMDCILYIVVVNTDATSHIQKTPEKRIKPWSAGGNVSTWMPVSNSVINFPP